MLEELTYKIRGCIFEVHKELGPGLLESIYESALAYELSYLKDKETLIRIVNNYSSVDSAISARDQNILE